MADYRYQVWGIKAAQGIGDDEKYCPRCQQVKKKSEFHRNRAQDDGLQSYCKSCQNEITTQNKREVAEIRQRYKLRTKGA